MVGAVGVTAHMAEGSGGDRPEAAHAVTGPGVIARVRPERGRTVRAAGFGYLVLCALGLGVGGALVDYSLTAQAMHACRDGFSASDGFTLNVHLMTRVMLMPAIAVVGAALSLSLGRRALGSPRGRLPFARAAIAAAMIVVAAAGPVALTLYDRAHADSAACVGLKGP